MRLKKIKILRIVSRGLGSECRGVECFRRFRDGFYQGIGACILHAVWKHFGVLIFIFNAKEFNCGVSEATAVGTRSG